MCKSRILSSAPHGANTLKCGDRAARGQSGFSLIEIALVLIIVGLALGGIISALGPQLQQRSYTSTQQQLTEANEAIVAFALQNRRLPCPATAASAGLESFCTNASGPCGAPVGPPAAAARGRCFAAANAGFVPAATLGLVGQGGDGSLRDAWAARLRYTVNTVLNTTAPAPPTTATNNTATALACGAGAATCSPFTQVNGIRNAYYGPVSTPTSTVFVCGTATGIAAANCGVAAQRANPAFVVYSLGQNTPTLGTDENANNDLDRVFVFHERTDITAPPPNGGFDDLFTWTTVDALTARMTTAGALP